MLGPDPNRELLKDSTRLVAFLQECLALGSLQGFRHFETFARGREELVLCVHSSQFSRKFSTLMPLPVLETYYPRSKVAQWNAPELLSPLDEHLKKEKKRTVFLIAGYAKYRCPYVWLRSHHEELIHDKEEDDNPLQLLKTTEWKNRNVSLWEIVTEILSMTNNPSNPFELDFEFIDKLPLEENIFLTGSLLAFLEDVYIQADPSTSFVNEVYQDIEKLRTRHLNNMYKYSVKSLQKAE